MARREPTAAQKEQAKQRRERMRALAKRIGAMEEGERLALAERAGIRTIEGRPLSVHNQCMIIMQDAAATVVGGFQQWRKAGRCVRKGEHGCAIWFPIGKGESEATEPGTPDDLRFGLATVFDIRQTDPVEAGELVAA